MRLTVLRHKIEAYPVGVLFGIGTVEENQDGGRIVVVLDHKLHHLPA